MQLDLMWETPSGVEDCLVVNVYSRAQIPMSSKEELPKASKADVLLPVVVFSHGGAFANGNGGPSFLEPYYFMNEDIVSTVKISILRYCWSAVKVS